MSRSRAALRFLYIDDYSLDPRSTTKLRFIPSNSVGDRPSRICASSSLLDEATDQVTGAPLGEEVVESEPIPPFVFLSALRGAIRAALSSGSAPSEGQSAKR